MAKRTLVPTAAASQSRNSRLHLMCSHQKNMHSLSLSRRPLSFQKPSISQHTVFQNNFPDIVVRTNYQWVVSVERNMTCQLGKRACLSANFKDPFEQCYKPLANLISLCCQVLGISVPVRSFCLVILMVEGSFTHTSKAPATLVWCVPREQVFKSKQSTGYKGRPTHCTVLQFSVSVLPPPSIAKKANSCNLF